MPRRWARLSGTVCFNPLSSSGRLQGSTCFRGVCSRSWFQSPFFIGASSGGCVPLVRVNDPGVSIPFLHRGVFRAAPTVQPTADPASFQSPFFIGASSGVARLRPASSQSWVSIPFLHRGVFRGRPDGAYENLGEVSIPFLHRGVFRGKTYVSMRMGW